MSWLYTYTKKKGKIIRRLISKNTNFVRFGLVLDAKLISVRAKIKFTIWNSWVAYPQLAKFRLHILRRLYSASDVCVGDGVRAFHLLFVVTADDRSPKPLYLRIIWIHEVNVRTVWRNIVTSVCNDALCAAISFIKDSVDELPTFPGDLRVVLDRNLFFILGRCIVSELSRTCLSRFNY